MKVMQINSGYEKSNINNTNFKAYNIKTLENGLKQGKAPELSVIKEVHADAMRLRQSTKFDDKMQSSVLSTLVIGLLAVSKWNLWGEKSKLEASLAATKAKLLIAKSENNEELTHQIRGYSDSIKEADRKLAELNETQALLDAEKLS